MALQYLGGGFGLSHDIATLLCHGSVMSRVQIKSCGYEWCHSPVAWH